MKRTIEDLWEGNIASAGNCGVGNPEIEDLVIRIECHKEKLNKELGLQQKDIFEKYVGCTEEFMYLITKCAFCDGFSIASKLMAEALSEDS